MSSIERSLANLAVDSDYDSDTEGVLIYRDCISGNHPLLEPALPIRDPNMFIGKVGQQNLLAQHFTLKPKDLEETHITREDGVLIGKPIPPGISAFLYFGTQNSKQHQLESLTKSHLGRDMHWKNRLYVAQIRDINEAGWECFYAPLINRAYPIFNPLHVILVPNSLITSSIVTDAHASEKLALTKAFIRWEG